ncbi:hypothetical protein HK097_011254 [Rhizophlyctis rosea]|uniref:Uncharacterized protein n=1 Tax=Rhizophlyctis rosea TaxID=64517 RepID=A0AAD5S8B4_9FUNG|nr:hypothetical protein HK097_011254 [Rhizophlyctis rosea]
MLTLTPEVFLIFALQLLSCLILRYRAKHRLPYFIIILHAIAYFLSNFSFDDLLLFIVVARVLVATVTLSMIAQLVACVRSRHALCERREWYEKGRVGLEGKG